MLVQCNMSAWKVTVMAQCNNIFCKYSILVCVLSGRIPDTSFSCTYSSSNPKYWKSRSLPREYKVPMYTLLSLTSLLLPVAHFSVLLRMCPNRARHQQTHFYGVSARLYNLLSRMNTNQKPLNEATISVTLHQLHYRLNFEARQKIIREEWTEFRSKVEIHLGKICMWELWQNLWSAIVLDSLISAENQKPSKLTQNLSKPN